MPPRAALDDRCDPERYHVLGEHGRGGLGKVMRAHDLRLGRDVAIKELISRGHVAEIRFAREAAITARLEHPGIVPVHEAGRWPDGTPFYAMKLVAGRPLRDLIAERGTVAERIGLLHHVIAVADAIAYAHGRGIIHRDLKPANIIVGDYGETVVIDWGLAKDLAAVEDAVDADPTSSARDESLTSAGAVLGTPAYMPPEQARGEAVDQRADVFAIGAMLWELCALERLPPADTGQRPRMLRRAAIDPDLAAIIEKAVDPEPARRYRDAGALAADLKAFKSGARIAARSYSPFHLLAHWTRRHRALALSVTAVLALAVVGIVLYVRNIAVERDRADAALRSAESATRAALEANATTEAALADQTLKRAELLLSSDPSAAEDVLATYRGRDHFARDLLRRQAEGRGVAEVRATPHASAIIWIRGMADHSIATLGVDGKLALTSPTGDVKVLARDASNTTTFAYAEKRQLLAYVCRGDRICLVDFSHSAPAISAPFGGGESDGLGFSPAEDRLAASGHSGSVVVWDVSNPRQPVERSRGRGVGWNITFLDADTLAVNTSDQLTLTTPRGTTQLALPHVTTQDASQARHTLAFGMADGTGAVVRPAATGLGRLARLCAGPVAAVQLMPQTDQVVFGCKNGSIGLWDLATFALTPLANLQGSGEYTAVSVDGRQIAIGGSSGVVSIIDLQTRIITSYLGHRVRLSTLAAPTADYPFFVSADVNGQLRGWVPPAPLARVALTAPLAIFDLQLLADSTTAIATSTGSPILVASPSGTREAAPHAVDAPWIAMSPDRTQFAAYGFGASFELWSAAGGELRRIQVIDAQQPATPQLRFLAADDLVWGGSAGRLVRWSRADGSHTIATFPQPITTFAVSPRDHALAVALADGALWSVALDGKASHLASQIENASTMQASSDGRWLATGNADGVVAVYDTASWRPATVLRSSGQIRNLAFSPRGDWLAVATTSGLVQLGRAATGASGVDWDPARITWTSFTAYPRDLAFSPDGDLAMISCAGGVVWFYSVARDRWLYYPTGITSSITAIRAGTDGHSAATADSDGRVLRFDLDAVRAALDSALHQQSLGEQQQQHRSGQRVP